MVKELEQVRIEAEEALSSRATKLADRETVHSLDIYAGS